VDRSLGKVEYFIAAFSHIINDGASVLCIIRHDGQEQQVGLFLLRLCSHT
jgi:hypothetical protein